MPLYVREGNQIYRVEKIEFDGKNFELFDGTGYRISYVFTPSQADAELIAHKYRQCIDRPHEVHIL